MKSDHQAAASRLAPSRSAAGVKALNPIETISTAINVYGHLGYELYPRGWPSHWCGRWINTSVAHNTHHATAQHNYGLYFLFWDRWCGTLDPKYEQRYAQARPAAAD
jgi:lathosterol oxidase